MRPVLLTSLHSSNFRMDKLRTAKRDLQHIPETEDEMQTNPIPHFTLIPFHNTNSKISKRTFAALYESSTKMK